MGLLDIFKKGLTNTRNFFSGGFTKIAASTGHFDEDMLDELEELMIRADCGVPASEELIGKVKDGDIILMHEIYDSTADALDRIIPKLLEDGYQLVTCSELVQAKSGNPPVPGTEYVSGTRTMN